MDGDSTINFVQWSILYDSLGWWKGCKNGLMVEVKSALFLSHIYETENVFPIFVSMLYFG